MIAKNCFIRVNNFPGIKSRTFADEIGKLVFRNSYVLGQMVIETFDSNFNSKHNSKFGFQEKNHM